MGKYKSRGNGFSWSRLFLVLLIVVCCAAVVWTANLLFTNQIGQIMGIIILLVAIGVLIWNVSLLHRYKVGAGAVVAVFVVTALVGATVCAFAGVEPLTSAKNRVSNWSKNLGGQLEDVEIPEPHAPEEVGVFIKIIDPARLGMPVHPYIEVVVYSNDYTEPGRVYYVEVVSSEHSFGKQAVRWDRIPGGLQGEHQGITLNFGFISDDSVFQAIAAQEKLPVSERKRINPRDFLTVIITK